MKYLIRYYAVAATFLIGSARAFADETGKIGNPLDPSISTIPKLVGAAMKVLVMVSLPIIALFIVYSGFLFILARGNESKLTEAKNNFLYVIIGTILILGAWVFANMLAGTIGQLTG